MTKWMKCVRCGGTGVIRTGHSYFTQDKCRSYHCVGGMIKNVWYVQDSELEEARKHFDRLGVSALTVTKLMVNLCPEILLPEGEDNITHDEAVQAVKRLNNDKD